MQRAGMEHHPAGNSGRGAPQTRYILLCLCLLFVILNDPQDDQFPARLYLGGMEKEEG
jgi:hypothetical protein